MTLRLSLAVCSLIPLGLFGVYAPIPQQEQGTPFTVEVASGISYDSNILGTPSDEIDSIVFNFAPTLRYNGPLGDRTFLTASYGFSANHYEERPGDSTLVNHTLGARIAHTFTPVTFLDISNTYRIIDDPETTLSGIPLTSNQSYDLNTFDARLRHSWDEQWTTAVKYRNTYYDYDFQPLGDSLDRYEHLFGLEANYQLNEKTTLIGEYRYLDINYRNNSAVNKDSDSHFFLLGADYAISRKVELKSRGGIEFRDRKAAGADDDTSFYGEFTSVYLYGQRSYASLGLRYDIRQTSDPISYTDEEVFAIVGNLQHALSPAFLAGLNIRFEDAKLLGRGPLDDINDERLRLGTNLTWLPDPRWAVILSYDYDNVSSDSLLREEERHRVGLSIRYSFGFEL